MARLPQPSLFETGSQPELFEADAAPPAYRRDPDHVRARLHRILAEARAEGGITSMFQATSHRFQQGP